MAEVNEHEMPDDQAHCRAAGLIARRCSTTEAWMASWGKELTDLFDGGDAEWRDLRSDSIGRRCAHSIASDEELATCCQNELAANRSKR